MSLFIVRTFTGSIYEIDTDAHTWERVSTTERSGQIREERGPFLFDRLYIEAGESLLLRKEHGGMIHTSRVMAVTTTKGETLSQQSNALAVERG